MKSSFTGLTSRLQSLGSTQKGTYASVFVPILSPNDLNWLTEDSLSITVLNK